MIVFRFHLWTHFFGNCVGDLRHLFLFTGRRPRLMIAFSWGLAALCSIPQAIFFKTDACVIHFTKEQWQVNTKENMFLVPVFYV